MAIDNQPIHGSMQIAHTVDYSLLVPQSAGPWPLLTILHGVGQVAGDFIRTFKGLSDRGIMIAAPQAPHHFYIKLSEGKVGFSWLTRYQRDRSIAEFVAYMNRFHQQIEHQYPIDRLRRYALGFSQGVSMAYRMILHSQVPFRGLIACGADLPPDIADRLDDLSALRFLLIQGRSDPIVPYPKAVEAYQMLVSRKIDSEMFEFDGGHSIPAAAIRRVADFVGGN